uniref:Uncharacterized protein n=1 Tax=Panagrellus redivivus TaxID=6233 RepID=A0A7E4UUP0_PANRE
MDDSHVCVVFVMSATSNAPLYGSNPAGRPKKREEGGPSIPNLLMGGIKSGVIYVEMSTVVCRRPKKRAKTAMGGPLVGRSRHDGGGVCCQSSGEVRFGGRRCCWIELVFLKVAPDVVFERIEA